MRIIKSFILLFLLVCLFGTVGLYAQFKNLGRISTFFSEQLSQNDYFFIFYQIACVLLVLLLFGLLILILMKPTSLKELWLEKADGQIKVSTSTLEAIAKCALAEFISNEYAGVKIRLTRKQKVNVIVTITEDEELLTRAKNIQEKIEQSLLKMVQVETDRIKIVVKKKTKHEAMSIEKKHLPII